MMSWLRWQRTAITSQSWNSDPGVACPYPGTIDDENGKQDAIRLDDGCRSFQGNWRPHR